MEPGIAHHDDDNKIGNVIVPFTDTASLIVCFQNCNLGLCRHQISTIQPHGILISDTLPCFRII